MLLPSSAEIGYPVRWHAAADVGGSRAMADIQWFIVHDTEGRMAGDESVLTSGAPPVESAHALIDRDGSLVFMVPLDVTAWTPGNDDVAMASVNVELSGFSKEPYSVPQYRSLAAFFRWCVKAGMVNCPPVYIGRSDGDGGPFPDKPGIIGHQDVPDPDHRGQWGGAGHHVDPGPLFDWEKLVGLIAGGPLPPSPVPPAPVILPDNPLGAVPMVHPFSSRWMLLNGMGLALPMMGYPAKPERVVGGRRVQKFERGWYGVQAAPAPWDVVALLPGEIPAEG